MLIKIIFGTESGETELRAEEIADVLSSQFEVSIENMEDVLVEDIDLTAFYVVVCSTHGEGGLPSSAQPFFDALEEHRPDLSGLRYSVFGRGDRTYLNTYSRGSEIINEKLTELGAQRVGEYGREDVSDWNAPSDLVEVWAASVAASLLIGVEVSR